MKSIALPPLIVRLFCAAYFAAMATRATAAATLTNAAAVLALPDEQAASALPVRVEGIVTAAETNWNGRFFVQDSSAGVFVVNLNKQQPKVGDRVEVTGVTRAGGYAPCIAKPHWRKLGSAPLPEARRVPIDQLMSGAADSQRLEVSGVIRSATEGASRLGIELVSGGYRLRAFSPIPPHLDPQSLIGARVRLQGTAAAGYNAPLRHFVTITLFVPQLSDFVIEEPAPAHPFAQPLTPLNGIAQYPRTRSPGNQVHVKGVATFQRNGQDLFLQDASGGLQVKTKTTLAVAPGTVVDAVGFPAVENFLPVLEDALIQPSDEPHVRLEPRKVSTAEVQKGLHHADYVTLEGRLIDRLTKGISRHNSGKTTQTALILQSSNFMFVAERDTTRANDVLDSIPIGSLVEASGIAFLDSGENGKAKSLQLILPGSHTVRVLERPSWFTPQHLVVTLAGALAVLLVTIGWSVMVSKQNSVLEERVRERTTELKVEMTARKESELQFRAVLTERTRLAQELHDTLDQTMTGIALQLALVSDFFQSSPSEASHHLKLARSLMRQGQTDVRQSVWGLRCRANEEFNLVNAMVINARQIAGCAGLKIQVDTSSETQPLSEVVEEDLLRIAQEAVTNIVKHAEAKSVHVSLEFREREVVLQIKDDGKGFYPETCAGPKDGHFGLLGIRERAQRLGGSVVIASAPGEGARIRVEIPILSPRDGQSVDRTLELCEERTVA